MHDITVRCMELMACERLSINPYGRAWPELTADEQMEAMAFDDGRRDQLMHMIDGFVPRSEK